MQANSLQAVPQQISLPRWLYFWNGFMVACCSVLVVIDQQTVFGDAAKWFFCALIFAALKFVLKSVVS